MSCPSLCSNLREALSHLLPTHSPSHLLDFSPGLITVTDGTTDRYGQSGVCFPLLEHELPAGVLCLAYCCVPVAQHIVGAPQTFVKLMSGLHDLAGKGPAQDPVGPTMQESPKSGGHSSIVTKHGRWSPEVRQWRGWRGWVASKSCFLWLLWEDKLGLQAEENLFGRPQKDN